MLTFSSSPPRDGVPLMRSKRILTLDWAHWVNPSISDRPWNCRSREASHVKDTTMRRWIRDFMVAAGMLAAITVGAGLASAYDVMEVQHGGTVEGTIRLDGPVPEPKGFNLIMFPDPAY